MALTAVRDACSPMVREHIDWALSGTKLAASS
jgi:epoxyqueuosine reductase QueG